MFRKLFRVVLFFHATRVSRGMISDDFVLPQVDDIVSGLLQNKTYVRKEITLPSDVDPFLEKLKAKSNVSKTTQTRFIRGATPKMTLWPVLSTVKPNKELMKSFISTIRNRMKMREVEMILNRKHDPLAELKNNTDVVTQIGNTLRQSSILTWHALLWPVTLAQSSVSVFWRLRPLNYYYPDFMSAYLQATSFMVYHSPARNWVVDKNYTMTAMNQWIFRTQFNLQYVQALRNKYLYNERFRIGFCFALFRQLIYEMKMVFNAMAYHWDKLSHYDHHLRTYERLVRLDVDIKDVIRYIKELEYQRKQKEDPDFYKYFPSSDPPVFR